jgi:hypothetical protein
VTEAIIIGIPRVEGIYSRNLLGRGSRITDIWRRVMKLASLLNPRRLNAADLSDVASDLIAAGAPGGGVGAVGGTTPRLGTRTLVAR